MGDLSLPPRHSCHAYQKSIARSKDEDDSEIGGGGVAGAGFANNGEQRLLSTIKIKCWDTKRGGNIGRGNTQSRCTMGEIL